MSNVVTSILRTYPQLLVQNKAEYALSWSSKTTSGIGLVPQSLSQRSQHRSKKAKLPTHVEIDAKRYGFERDSVILLEQIRTIDKQRLTDKITHLDDEMMEKVDEALQVSLGLIEF